MVKLRQLFTVMLLGLFSYAPMCRADTLFHNEKFECPPKAYTAAPAVAPNGHDDQQIEKLLSVVWQELTAPDQEKYLRTLKRALKGRGESAYGAELCRRIADMYYERKRYVSAVCWYHKALSVNPTLNRSTTAGFKLNDAFRIIAYRWMRIASVVVLCLAFMVLTARLFYSRMKFDLPFFFKRTGSLVAISLLFIIAWAVADVLIARKTAAGLAAMAEFKHLISEPVVVFSFLDFGVPLLLISTLTAAFLPLVAATANAALARPFSRSISIILVVAVTVAGWAFVFTNYGFDDKFYLRGIPDTYRFYFRGDIETVLSKNPRKVLKANPRLLESDNDDLEKFIKKNFPEGMPGVKR